ncbi:CoA transferase, partial [Ottowia sp.]|uniref:CoA transferase n=1 Tax=Ottowia sp. TaxID=1898956 RepID=UPI0039E6EC6E
AIEQTFAALTAQDVIARLDEAQIANAAVNQVGDLWTHPQLHARQRFHTIGSPAGELQALLPPATVNSFDARMDAVPALGEHSEAILRALGRTDTDIAALRANGVI